jgi:hypothetical protein
MPFDRFGGAMAKTVAIGLAACVGVLVTGGIILNPTPLLAADECLAAPNAAAPAGSHWFYRLEHPTERKCWYVREQRQEAHTAAPKMRSAAKAPAARAAAIAVDQSAPAEQAEPEMPETPPTQAAGSANDPAPTVAFVARTSDPPATTNEQTTTDRRGVPSESTATAPQADAGGDSAGEAAQAIAKETAKSAAAVPPRMLLLVPAALAFAGVLARVIFSSAFGRRQDDGPQRGSGWGADIADLRQLPIRFNTKIAAAEPPVPQIEMPEDLKQTLRQVLQSLEARAA